MNNSDPLNLRSDVTLAKKVSRICGSTSCGVRDPTLAADRPK